MGLKKINDELARIGKIVEAWAKPGEISDIERELVLDKLKHIYEEVMFFQCAELPGDSCGERFADAGPALWETKTAKQDEACENAAPRPEDFPPAAQESAAGHTEKEPAGEPGPEIVCPETPGRNLFGEDEAADALSARPAVDRRVILSLYGEDAAPCKPAGQSAPSRETVAGITLTEQVKVTVKEPLADQAAKPVLGEVINAGGERLGDAFSKQSHPDDVASRVASALTHTLRKSIGINDKFLITKELFGGNAADYERALDDLERFDDLDELMIHIHDNYAWNPNGPGARALVEILTRKLS